jgi:hypothetical protein
MLWHIALYMPAPTAVRKFTFIAYGTVTAALSSVTEQIKALTASVLLCCRSTKPLLA